MSEPTHARFWRAAAGLALVAVAVAGAVLFRLHPERVAGIVSAGYALAHRMGAGGLALAAASQTAIALCGILPASAGAIAAGMMYGTGTGFLLSAAGTLAGAAAAFLLARGLFRPWAARLVARRSRLLRLDEAVARDGWRLVCLLRVSPVMPFAVASYALGLTSIRFRDYMLGTLASLPALLGYVLMGALAGSGMQTLVHGGSGGMLRWTLLGVSAIGTVLLTVHVGRLIARAAGRQSATTVADVLTAD